MQQSRQVLSIIFARRMFALQPVVGGRSASTFAHEPTLPRLPVPRLRATLDAYLDSLKPFYEERRWNAGELEQRKRWADELEASELGQRLQRRLEHIAQTTRYNWLDDTFWLKAAYHASRTPLVIHSNWWLLCGPDPTIPSDFVVPDGQFTDWQISRATLLASRYLDFKLRLDREDIPPDTSRAGAFCMHQYRRIFGVTRIPGQPADSFVDAPHPHPSRHLLVIAREQLYTLDVITEAGTARSREEIEAGLWAIVRDVEARGEEVDPAIPSLTAADRDTWAETRRHLLDLSEQNRETADLVETALFSLTLDDWTRTAPSRPSRATSILSSAQSEDSDLDAHLLNGSGGGPTPGRSRWFDKSVNISVESSGRASVLGEHSPAEALIPAIAVDYALAEPLAPRESFDETAGTGWSRLRWTTDERIRSEVEKAETSSEAIVADSDAALLYADEYGTDWIKAVGKQPPDAFIQMALQLAYRRLHGHYTAVYETASTRLFLHGRTDTIRSFTAASRAWCESMLSGEGDRFALFTAACARHQQLTRDASSGKGCDRHLLALRLLISPDDAKPALFADELFDESQEWRLSTSGLTAGERFAGTGFGAPLHDGYGINYLAGKSLIKFGIESKRSSTATDTEGFRLELARVMREMKELCEAAVPAAKT